MFICLILLVSFVYQQHQSRTGYSPPYHTWSEALKVLSRFCSASSVPGGNGYFKHWSWANGKGILIQVWNMWQGCCVLYATESNRNNYWKQTHLQLKLRESNWEVESTKMLTSQDTTYLFSGIPRNSKPMPSVLAWKRISLAEKYGHFHWQWSFRLFQFITSGDVFRLTLYGSPQCLESELENPKIWPKNTKKKVTYSYLALQSQTAPTFQVEVSLLQPPPTSNNNLFTFKIYRVPMKS